MAARHHRRIVAGVGTVLLGTGVTAFGIAPLAPDVGDLPVRQVVEPLSAATQGLLPGSLQAHQDGFVLYRNDTVRRDDNAQSLLQRLGVVDSQAQAFLRGDSLARQLFTGRPGKLVAIETSDRHELQRLTARWLSGGERGFERLVIERTPDGLQSRIEKGELTASSRLASGEIQSSLFASTDAIGLPDPVAVQLAEMFSAHIDFRRDLRRGDRFSLVYEVLEADGEALRSGRILSAEFINAGRAYHSVWFEAPGYKGGYYDFEGQSSLREYLSSPLEFTRVSSGYGMRFHPVHGDRRAHLGVDYAAPTGTPVRTVGDGVVSFSGRQGGYGNVVFVQHRRGHVTVYAHLSRIDVRQGQRLTQGQLVGAVGCTGTCTGPHLHFEFRDNGRHLDPLVALRNSESVPLAQNLRPQFEAVAQAQRQMLDAAATVVRASAE
ncbi:MAG TPA: peptidoglycan DD-metalloendopeptidase family protein [Hydrogenophaga sp.]|uniref:M23 family metallopeptidase n=1 Tax=Hydrogenophaga sp. TaxID=1904254 RepID=UPI002CCAD956|nr:peptidoglycan DD-metalloendopeptidase family protein [Hydrogenophaga sp.]HMN93662.1 peptidoglycan DD-metalloendopeptidase family protein [Hydrogenophaga sp.]